jgi:hypothetical protein
VVTTIINHPMLDDLYNPFMVILGIVYYCVNHINSSADLSIDAQDNGIAQCPQGPRMAQGRVRCS